MLSLFYEITPSISNLGWLCAVVLCVYPNWKILTWAMSRLTLNRAVAAFFLSGIGLISIVHLILIGRPL